MAAPVPTLAPNFEQRVMREIQRTAQPLSRNARILLIAYAFVSVLASAVVMRGQGLRWQVIAATLLAAVASIPPLGWTRRIRLRQGE